MIASRLYKALQQRGVQQMFSASQHQTTPFFNTPARFFSKDNKEGEEAAAEQAQEEVEQVEEVAKPEPAPKKPEAKAAPKAAAGSDGQAAVVFDTLDKALFEPFSVGNIKVIESTPDHRPPSEEDTIEGRYSGVLFTTAS